METNALALHAARGAPRLTIAPMSWRVGGGVCAVEPKILMAACALPWPWRPRVGHDEASLKSERRLSQAFGVQPRVGSSAPSSTATMFVGQGKLVMLSSTALEALAWSRALERHRGAIDIDNRYHICDGLGMPRGPDDFRPPKATGALRWQPPVALSPWVRENEPAASGAAVSRSAPRAHWDGDGARLARPAGPGMLAELVMTAAVASGAALLTCAALHAAGAFHPYSQRWPPAVSER